MCIKKQNAFPAAAMAQGAWLQAGLGWGTAESSGGSRALRPPRQLSQGLALGLSSGEGSGLWRRGIFCFLQTCSEAGERSSG